MVHRRSGPRVYAGDDVVALLDGSAHGALAVHLAAVEAAATNACLHVEVVVETGPAGPDGHVDPGRGHPFAPGGHSGTGTAHELLNRAERALSRGWPDLRVRSYVRYGSVAENLAAVTASARLLSLGVVGRREWRHRVGSSAAAALAAGRCTVLLARAGFGRGAPAGEVRALALTAGAPQDPQFQEVGNALAVHCGTTLQLLDLGPRRWRRPSPNSLAEAVPSDLSQGPVPGFVVVDTSVSPGVAGVVAAA
ncbi:hypothetical protein [Kineococcus sp. SYSU DK003]|uniref:hypothetical protein n=1 Tax=Kineococcus sp. SYSU DK003 TaxID=3383124 RepID=UPI003D7DDF1E